MSHNGLTPILVATSYSNKFQPDPDEIAHKLSRRTACVFLTSPGNPCNTYLPEESLKKIIELSASYNAVVALDAIFEESTVRPNQSFFCLYDYDKIIKLKGLSKDRPHMNDLRLGWSVSRNEGINKEMYLASEASGFCISRTVDAIARQEMSLRVQLDKINKLDYISTELEIYRREIESFYDMIKEGINQARGAARLYYSIEKTCDVHAGNLLFTKIGQETHLDRRITSGRELFDFLIDRTNVAVTPGHIFKANEDGIWFRTTMSMKPTDFLGHYKKILEVLK